MGFFCEAAQCWADDAKRRNYGKYPWMRDVTWVKFPTDKVQRKAWKNLLRRKDNFELKTTSRICSRHFQKGAISADGTANVPPRYFLWNNFGQDEVRRGRSAPSERREIFAGSRSSPSLAASPWDVEPNARRPPREVQGVPPSPTDSVPVPDAADEVTIATHTRQKKRKREETVGHMEPVATCTRPPPSQDHDYLKLHFGTMNSVGTQTLLTSADITVLEEQAAACQPKGQLDEFIDRGVTGSDERVNFYTGFDSNSLLQGVWQSIKGGAEGMKYWRGSASATSKQYEEKKHRKPGRQRTLPLFYQFLMTLIRLRLNLPLLLLADLFFVGTTTVSEITITWIAYLHQTLCPALIHWPSQSIVRKMMPRNFQKFFPSVRVIIDCTEFYMDRPRNKEEQYKTFSQYKSHNTYKCLIGINPNGAFTFISELWGGNVSDKHLTQQSGLLDLLDEGDAVMADRGFHIEDDLLMCGSTLIAPPFTRKTADGKGKRLNVKEIQRTREIARFRIHVERAIQRLKTFRILKHQIPVSLNEISSMIVRVVGAICNLKGPLYHDTPQSRKSKGGKKPCKR